MAVAARSFEERVGWGGPASLALHAACLALLLIYLPKPRIFRTPPEESVSVEIVPGSTQAEPSAPPADIRPQPQQAPAAPLAPPAADQPGRVLVPPVIKPAPAPGALVSARQLFSGGVLSDPRSKKARAALRQLSGDERNLQLCGLEAMEQVRRTRPGSNPDAIAPYAMAPERIRGGSIEVKGGAFRSKRLWYAIRFSCEVDEGSGAVRSFAFAIGDAIPKDLWREHNLVADDGAAD